MLLKAVKISEENYHWLSRLAGELQQQKGAPVSLDEALHSLQQGKKVSELAGGWEMSENEVKKIEKVLSRGWKRWQIESV